ncbi:MAG: hypothetical protein QM520_04865, partial [Gammaproteobacteria bacterium]|nr:hypothetical protein [Gammaproteobacteria bacterium]
MNKWKNTLQTHKNTGDASPRLPQGRPNLVSSVAVGNKWRQALNKPIYHTKSLETKGQESTKLSHFLKAQGFFVWMIIILLCLPI